MTETARSRDGTRIAYEASGEGPPLVVVNGALTDRTVAAGLRPLLEPHFTVVAYDRRGRAESGDTAPYSPEREVEDLAAVIDAAVAPAFVFGHSSGALLALRAAMRGVAMQGLAVNEPPFIVPGTRPLPPRDVTARIVERVDAGDREGALRVFLLEHVGVPPRALDAMKASPAWPTMLALAHTAPYDSEIADDSAVPTADLARLELPTLVLNGTASFPWIAETARAVAAALPNARAVSLAGQPHSPAPEVLAPALVSFFSR